MAQPQPGNAELILERVIYDLWRVEKEIEPVHYAVGLGSGVLKSGELTRAGKHVVDKCFSLYHLREETRGIVLIGGSPWISPPVSDVALMHRRLLKLGRSIPRLRVPPENVTILFGDTTYQQISALSKFLARNPQTNAVVVCPSMQSRRLRAILRKQGIFASMGIATVPDACEPRTPVEKFRWGQKRYFVREMLACIHHRLAGWI